MIVRSALVIFWRHSLYIRAYVRSILSCFQACFRSHENRGQCVLEFSFSFFFLLSISARFSLCLAGVCFSTACSKYWFLQLHSNLNRLKPLRPILMLLNLGKGGGTITEPTRLSLCCRSQGTLIHFDVGFTHTYKILGLLEAWPIQVKRFKNVSKSLFYVTSGSLLGYIEIIEWVYQVAGQTFFNFYKCRW